MVILQDGFGEMTMGDRHVATTSSGKESWRI